MFISFGNRNRCLVVHRFDILFITAFQSIFSGNSTSQSFTIFYQKNFIKIYSSTCLSIVSFQLLPLSLTTLYKKESGRAGMETSKDRPTVLRLLSQRFLQAYVVFFLVVLGFTSRGRYIWRETKDDKETTAWRKLRVPDDSMLDVGFFIS